MSRLLSTANHMHLQVIEEREPLQQGLGRRTEIRRRIPVILVVLTVIGGYNGDPHIRKAYQIHTRNTKKKHRAMTWRTVRILGPEQC